MIQVKPLGRCRTVTTVNPMEIRHYGRSVCTTSRKAILWKPGAGNKNLYTGQEVVPEGMKNLDGKDQWDSSTSLTAQVIAGLSPKLIDNAFRTSAAGSGQNLLHGMDFTVKAGRLLMTK